MSRRLKITLTVAFLTIALDLGTKAWALSALADEPADFGWVMLRLAQNTGVAFSLGASSPAWVVGAVTIGATVLIGVMALRGVLHPPAAGGLLLGGGLGNLIDRLIDGSVTDMIDLGWFPSFNVADIALNIGVGLVLIVGLFATHPDDDADADTDADSDADSDADELDTIQDTAADAGT
ncbi:MAG: signal peptidase II [Nonlabens sp.]